MKKGILGLIGILLLFVLFGCPNATDPGNDNNYTFEEGWYEYVDDNTVMFLKYGSNEVLERAGNRTGEFTGELFNNAKNTFVFSQKEVRQYLNPFGEYILALPSWCLSNLRIYNMTNDVLDNISITGSARYLNESHTSIELNAIGDTVTFDAFFYYDTDTKITYRVPELSISGESYDKLLINGNLNYSLSSYTFSPQNHFVYELKSLPNEDTKISVIVYEKGNANTLNYTFNITIKGTN